MELKTFFEQNPSGALAFSGGTDSSLLVWAAAQYGEDWRAYYVRSAFQPAFELADARKVAHQCQLPLTIIEADTLHRPEVMANPADRCYHCKRRIFSAILHQAAADGRSLVIDGTNASDDAEDRPGMKALRECGLTKGDVRALCREAGLPVWNKPSYACLATRIPAGTPITADALQRIEQSENLLASIGFRDFRVRLRSDTAVLQFTEDQFLYAWESRKKLCTCLAPMFAQVTLDLTPGRASH